MAKERINPDTGVVEVQDGVVDAFFNIWVPKDV